MEYMGITEWLIMIAVFVLVMINLVISDFGIAILCGLVAFVAVIVICCSIRHKKEKLIRVAAVIMGLCPTIAIIWYLLFPTAFPYVDLWVLGKTEEQIMEVYGEPSFDTDEAHGHNEMAYYTRYIFLDPEYYVITFDENGKAVDVREDLFVPLGG